MKADRLTWRERLGNVIFESDTRAGRAFDVFLLWAIVVASLAVILESVDSLGASYGAFFHWMELGITGLFTLEYVARIVTARRRSRYVLSFFGLVDLLAIMPTWLSILVPGTQAFAVIRILRLLRIFRVLKLTRYITEAHMLVEAIRASRLKIMVFLSAVGVLVTLAGSAMYLIEGPANGFTSIPRGIYWAVVTVTTVGYGDVAPHTTFGQFLAVLLMITGFGIIAVPTGMVTVEIVEAAGRRGLPGKRVCTGCGKPGHDGDARHCKYCGNPLSGWRRRGRTGRVKGG